jgi:hypothetical protein
MSGALALLRVTIAFAVLKPTEPDLVMLRRWLDSRRGLGDIVMAMRRLGFKLGLEDFGERRVAAFCTGIGGHEELTAAGVAQEATAWAAGQQAAWEVMRHGASRG